VGCVCGACVTSTVNMVHDAWSGNRTHKESSREQMFLIFNYNGNLHMLMYLCQKTRESMYALRCVGTLFTPSRPPI
jgi:hypothetical protein